MERRELQAAPNNELYIHDLNDILNVSREHLQIEQLDDGSYMVEDRDSTCGTIVDDTPIGSVEESTRCPLKEGSLIRVGTPESPFVYRFVTEPQGA